MSAQLAREASLVSPRLTSAAQLIACLVIIAGCSLPVFRAGPAPLTSDESLYTTEALNIATGKGLTYPTGEPIVHRAPLYPAFLALVFKVDGVSLENAYLVTRLATLANAVLVFFLARSLFSSLAGLVAGVLAATSPYLTGLGTTLFLDGTQTTFVLASLLAFWHARQKGSLPLHVLAGVLLGLAFLVKESAILLLPLAVFYGLLYGDEKGRNRFIIGWPGGFVAATGWWWAWVYLQSDSIYLVGYVHAAVVLEKLALAAAAAFVVAVLLGLLPSGERARRGHWPRVFRFAALAGAAAWGIASIVELQQVSWEHAGDYLRTVPAYFREVFAPAVQPAVLIAVAWAWAIVEMVRGRRQESLLVLAAAAVLPFVLFIANRGLSLRDALPLVYLSYVVLGGGSAALVAWGEQVSASQREPWVRYAGLAAVLLMTLVFAARGVGRQDVPTAAALGASWDNPLADDLAGWLETNVAPGTPVMSTRLYYSQLYFLTEGRYPVHQLPTVEVVPDPQWPPLLRRRSTLFRWEHVTFDRPGDRWLYLTRYTEKGYYIALAESDLLARLHTAGIAYVVISLADASGFSSPSLLPYFETHPAFTLVYEKQISFDSRALVFQLDPRRLDARIVPAQVTEAAYAGLEARFPGQDVPALLERLSPAGFAITPR